MRLLIYASLVLGPILSVSLSTVSLSTVSLSTASGAEPVAAAATEIAPEHHPWGQFKPGAWRRVRLVTEQLDDKGQVSTTSITTRTTTLLDVEADGVRLEDDIVHEVASVRFPRDPEMAKLGFHDALITDDLKVRETGSAEVVVEDRKITCSVFRLEFSGPASKTVTDVCYSPSVAPYVLKRQSVTTDLEGTNSRSETTTEVVALDMPCKVLAEIQNVAYVKTVLKHPKGITTTWSATSVQVPGGVVWQSSKELDKTGRLIRRSTLELIDYGLELEPARAGLFGRTRRGLFRNPLPALQPR